MIKATIFALFIGNILHADEQMHDSHITYRPANSEEQRWKRVEEKLAEVERQNKIDQARLAAKRSEASVRRAGRPKP